jgi:hypothetical protein
LNEEHFVAEAISNIVPFRLPRLNLENQDNGLGDSLADNERLVLVRFGGVPSDRLSNSQ